MGSFQEQLEQRAGGSLAGLQASNEQVRSWNAGVESGHARAFDDRVLLGLGIEARKPAYGDQVAYQAQVGRELGRSDRWVRETVQVALGIRTALEFGVDLPVELRRIPWRVVPTAIENLKAGRALDYRPPKEKKAPTVRGVRKLVKQLVQALKDLEEAEIRERERALAIEALTELEMPDVEEPEVDTAVSWTAEPAGEPSGEVAAEPAEEPTATPSRPGRRRPGRRGPGRGRGRGSGGRGNGG